MNATTQLAIAMKSAGYNIGRGPLYRLAVNLLGKSNRNPYIPRHGFIEAIQQDPDLAAAFIHECALAYLMVVAEDMGGTALGKPAVAGGGQFGGDTQYGSASPSSTGIGGDADAAAAGQSPGDTHSLSARAAALQNTTPSQTAGGGQSGSDTHQAVASPASPKAWSPAGIHVRDHSRSKPVPTAPGIGIEKPNRLVVPKPNKPHVSPAALFAGHMSVTLGALGLLDSIIVNNRPLRDVTVAEAREWAEKHRINGGEFVSRGRTFIRQAAEVEALTHGLPENVRVGNFTEFFDQKEAVRRLNAVEAAHAA
jgi:hypothetical protein